MFVNFRYPTRQLLYIETLLPHLFINLPSYASDLLLFPAPSLAKHSLLMIMNRIKPQLTRSRFASAPDSPKLLDRPLLHRVLPFLQKKCRMNSIGMIRTKNSPANFNHFRHQLNRFIPLILAPKSSCKICHTFQSTWMLKAQHLLSRLHDCQL